MKTAYCMIREHPHYRREAFIGGLRRAGFEVKTQQPGQGKPDDVLVLWNRYGERNSIANRFERDGGLVLIAENGYIGSDSEGRQRYALACHGHNGSGWWPEIPERFEQLMIEPKPWRESGDFIYVRDQRGIGSPSMASPPDFLRDMVELLQRRTKMRVKGVPHPGKPAGDPSQYAGLIAALAGAHACVIWSSATGVRALVEGIPVFYIAPHWICEGAANRGVDEIMSPLLDDAARLRALQRMAAAQWTVEELESGEPFARLIECNAAQRGAEKVAAP